MKKLFTKAICLGLVATLIMGLAVVGTSAKTIKKPGTSKIYEFYCQVYSDKGNDGEACVGFDKVKNAKGYQVKVSTDKKFKKNVKTITVKENQDKDFDWNEGVINFSKKFKGKVGKKYYAKVRAYNKSGKKKKYGKWSKVKSTKCQKITWDDEEDDSDFYDE